MKAIAAEIRKHDASVTTDDIKKYTLRNQLRRESKKMKLSQSQEVGVRMLIPLKFNTHYIAHYSVIL